MKIDEVQVGETYAVSRSGYDNPLRGGEAVVKVVDIQRVEEKTSGWSAKTRNVRRLIVEFVQPYVERAFYSEKVVAEYAAGERYPTPLDAKNLVSLWSEYQEQQAAEVERFRPGKERVQRLTEALGPYFAETQIRPSHSDNERGDLVIRIDYATVDEMLDRLKQATHAG